MTRNQRVVVAHGDPQVLTSYSEILLKAGYQVSKAITAAHCLALAREGRPCLVIAGGPLPDMTATQLCRELKTNGRSEDIFVVLAGGLKPTVGSEQQTSERAAGPDDSIPEGMAAAELLGRTSTWLRR